MIDVAWMASAEQGNPCGWGDLIRTHDPEPTLDWWRSIDAPKAQVETHFEQRGGVPVPDEATTVFRLQIWVISDQKGVAVFTPSMIGPDRVTDSLKKAATKIVGATVDAARAVMPVIEDSGAQVTYTYGTGGAVRFAAAQSPGILRLLQAAVADALIESGFGVFTE